MDDKVKGLLQSKTVWGGILMVAAVAFPSLGLTDAEQSSVVETVIGLVGAVLAIIGRIVATQPVAGFFKRQS